MAHRTQIGVSMEEIPKAFDKFQIIREISRGSFGITYVATDGKHDCALKWMRPDAPEEGRARFSKRNLGLAAA